MGSCSGSGQTKDYKIGIFCFSVQYAALRRKSKDWLALNRYNVSKWDDILLFVIVSLMQSILISTPIYFWIFFPGNMETSIINMVLLIVWITIWHQWMRNCKFVYRTFGLVNQGDSPDRINFDQTHDEHSHANLYAVV
jgi:hypothetical protein